MNKSINKIEVRECKKKKNMFDKISTWINQFLKKVNKNQELKNGNTKV